MHVRQQPTPCGRQNKHNFGYIVAKLLLYHSIRNSLIDKFQLTIHSSVQLHWKQT